MLHYFKFRQDLLDPVAAKEVYIKRPPGKGWPEHCPPIRAANSFGFDLLANFDIVFTQRRGVWKVQPDLVIESDFGYASTRSSPGTPLVQQYAWFWQKGQRIPHVITDNVYNAIKTQVKISSFLFLKTDPNEMLYMTDIPNMSRPWRAMTAVVETDWYSASYPWHVVVELDRTAKRIAIKKGDPLCRVIPVQRATYRASPMSPRAFEKFFDRGQQWLAHHGNFEHETSAQGVADITRVYAKQQKRAQFLVAGE
jgi:hypothetical protein